MELQHVQMVSKRTEPLGGVKESLGGMVSPSNQRYWIRSHTMISLVINAVDILSQDLNLHRAYAELVLQHFGWFPLKLNFTFKKIDLLLMFDEKVWKYTTFKLTLFCQKLWQNTINKWYSANQPKEMTSALWRLVVQNEGKSSNRKNTVQKTSNITFLCIKAIFQNLLFFLLFCPTGKRWKRLKYLKWEVVSQDLSTNTEHVALTTINDEFAVFNTLFCFLIATVDGRLLYKEGIRIALECTGILAEADSFWDLPAEYKDPEYLQRVFVSVLSRLMAVLLLLKKLQERGFQFWCLKDISMRGI